LRQAASAHALTGAVHVQPLLRALGGATFGLLFAAVDIALLRIARLFSA
jgi:hypothetical protein